MPMFATVLLGLAGQAAWKLATYLYERVTAPSAAAKAAPTVGAPATFERALAQAGAADGASRSDVPRSPFRLPAASPAVSAGASGSAAGPGPRPSGVADLYRKMAEEVQAP